MTCSDRRIMETRGWRLVLMNVAVVEGRFNGFFIAWRLSCSGFKVKQYVKLGRSFVRPVGIS